MLNHRRFDIVPYLFILPAFLVFTLVVVYPVGDGVWLSLQDWDLLGPKKFVGLANYAKLFLADPVFLKAVWHNVVYVALVVTVPIGLSSVIAVIVDGLPQRRLADVLRGLYFIPAILSVIVIGMIWGWVYNPYIGVLNGLIHLFTGRNVQIAWLGDKTFALYGVIITRCWMSVGFCMVVILAGLRAIPEEYYEAARIDGASAARVFRRITLPMLRPAFAVLLLVNTVDAFKEFALVYKMTKGGPYQSTELISTYMYDKAFVSWRVGYSSAMGVVLFLIILLASLGLRRLTERFEDA
jgi:raffinose/stachyose/melibiose transport system permease protein